MGVTACLLGYADNYVNTKVKLAIDRASLTTLNSKDEIQLAQSLIKIHDGQIWLNFVNQEERLVWLQLD